MTQVADLSTLKIREFCPDSDLETVHALLGTSYWWTPSLLDVARSAQNSFLVLVAEQEGQILGYGRVVSDGVRFAYICDIIVSENARGLGIGKQIVETMLEHHELKSCHRWLLATKDAHNYYRPFGFHELANGDMWMERPAPNLPCSVKC